MTDFNLVLMRHGESPSSFNVADFDRPLSDAGMAACREMGQRLAKIPDLSGAVACVSSATRTRMTWEQLCQSELFQSMPVTFSKEIYEQNLNAILSVVAGALGDGGQSAIIVGHNPVISELACQLTGNLHRMQPADALWLRCSGAVLVEAMQDGSPWQLAKIPGS